MIPPSIPLAQCHIDIEARGREPHKNRIETERGLFRSENLFWDESPTSWRQKPGVRRSLPEQRGAGQSY